VTNSEIIRNLELARAALEWEYPMDYCVAIDEAIEIVKRNADDGKTIDHIADVGKKEETN